MKVYMDMRSYKGRKARSEKQFNVECIFFTWPIFFSSFFTAAFLLLRSPLDMPNVALALKIF